MQGVAVAPGGLLCTTPSDTNGQISLEVSGQAGTGRTQVVRTFDYDLSPATSLDDVYWTNYETRDPVLGALLPSPPSGYQYCATRVGEPSSDSYGQSPNNQAVNAGFPSTGPPGNGACEVSFQTGDTLNGPVFSNDTFRIVRLAPCSTSTQWRAATSTTPPRRALVGSTRGGQQDVEASLRPLTALRSTPR